MKSDTIEINGEKYVKESSIKSGIKKEVDGLKYSIIRTYSAGVFAGYVKERDGKEGTIINSRKLWYWSGAFTLNAIAKDGVSNADACKFSCEVDETLLTEIIEIIPCTEEAFASIQSVQVWTP